MIYQDSNVLIINKPYGMLSQKAKPSDISVNELIVPYCLEHGILKESDLELVRPSVCNRLDRNTTGLLIAGLSLEGLQTMAEVLRDRSVRKYYYCIVKGMVNKKTRISGYICKDHRENKVSFSERKISGGSRIETKYGDRGVNLQMKQKFGVKHQLLHCGCLEFPEGMKRCGELSGRTVAAEPPETFLRTANELFGRVVWEPGI